MFIAFEQAMQALPPLVLLAAPVIAAASRTVQTWAAAGVGLPHSAEMQYNALPHVPMGALQPGDLVFYGNPIHHVGMYVGPGTMIEAPHSGAVVRSATAPLGARSRFSRAFLPMQTVARRGRRIERRDRPAPQTACPD